MRKQEVMQLCQTTISLLEQNQQVILSHFDHKLYDHIPSLVSNLDELDSKQKSELAKSLFFSLINTGDIESVLLKDREVTPQHWPIAPEHYPIIGEYLLEAIKEVIGDSVEGSIITAWQQAFEALLESFVQGITKKDHTPFSDVDEDGFRKLIVTKRVLESELVQSFYLKSTNDTQLEPFQAGQHIRIKVKLPNQSETHIRYFSLSDSPDKDYYRITIKKEIPKQEGKLTPTNYVYDEIGVGDRLYVSPPAGEFTLDEDSQSPVVLISGGVGMTPLVSMLNAIACNQPERLVTFIHATANSITHSFRESIHDLSQKNKNITSFVCYDNPSDQDQDRDLRRFDREGYVTLDFLKRILPDKQADFYFCGPTPFMKVVFKALKDWGVPKEHIHYEYFGPGDLEDF